MLILLQDLVDDFAVRPGYAVIDAENWKMQTYKNLGPNFIFYPVAFETLGPMGETTWFFFNDFSRRFVKKAVEKRSKLKKKQIISSTVALLYCSILAIFPV